MHPLGIAIQAACDSARDFYIIVGGTPALRLKMGLPQSVAKQTPLLLAFEAAFHAYSRPTPMDEGFSCILSFDTLYECRIPYSAIERFILQNPEAPRWPESWRDGDETETIPEPPPPPEPLPDNVRPFPPRAGRKPA